MSYKERSIWVSLSILIFIWVTYFIDIVRLEQANMLTTDAVNHLLFYVVVQTIVIEIVLQIVLAIIDHKNMDELEDERDKLISLHGSRYAYGIICVGVFIAVFHTTLPTFTFLEFPFKALSATYQMMHLIIVFAVLSEVIKLSTQLFYYRKGF